MMKKQSMRRREATGQMGMGNRIWRSIFRRPLVPRDDTDRKRVMIDALVFHFRPIRIPRATARYTHTFGLGGSSLVLFLVLVATGVLLIFVYDPSPGLAFESIVRLRDRVFFGTLIRNIHHWTANLLVLVVGLHLLRTYFTAAYHAPRQFNWVLGLFLLACVLAANVTGYLLPWDQLAYWATTIVTGMLQYVPLAGPSLEALVRGGPDVGAATLTYFYALHTTVIPVLVVVLMAFHFWRVRKARGVVVPRAPGQDPVESPETVLTLPNLLLREFALALVLIAFVMVVALLFDAPLGGAANPGMSPNPAKAPWYFVGVQELLLHFHPLFAVVVLPLAAAAGLLLIPYLRYDEDTSGVLFVSRRGRRLSLASAATALAITPVLIVLDEYWVDFAAWMPGVPRVVTTGVLPAGLLFAGLAGFYAYSRRRWGANNNEAVQAVFVLVAVAFAVLTVTGVWFRGPGMALVWPWSFQ